VDAGGLAPSILLEGADAKNIKPADVQAVIEAKRAQYAKMFPEYQEVADPAPVPKIEGKGVAAIDFTYTVAKVLPLRVRQFWIVADGRVYNVTCTSLRDTYGRNEPAFQAALETVTVP
jgi:hypothetical protein